MSSADATSFIGANYGPLVDLLVGTKSVFARRPYTMHSIYFEDFASRQIPTRNRDANFGDKLTFQINKTTSLVGQLVLEFVITPGTALAPGDAVFVNDLGYNLIEHLQVRYQSHILQEFNGDIMHYKRRAWENTISDSCDSALRLDRIAYGSANETAVLRANASGGGASFKVYADLTELIFAKYFDQLLQPEALAANIEIDITLRNLNELLVTNGTAINTIFPGGANPAPKINSVTMLPRLFELTAAEHASMLKQHSLGQGFVHKFHDYEFQKNVNIPVGVTEHRIVLNNLRLDMNNIFFWIRKQDSNTAPVRDRLSYDTSPSIITGAAVNGILSEVEADGLSSIKLEANGKTVVAEIDALFLRLKIGRRVHPRKENDCMYYEVPFAISTEQARDAMGHQNAANLNQKELILKFKAPTAEAYEVDIYAMSENFIQYKDGSVRKTLH